jgi:hypothetical protein
MIPKEIFYITNPYREGEGRTTKSPLEFKCGQTKRREKRKAQRNKI